jgi:hypothetical protein
VYWNCLVSSLVLLYDHIQITIRAVFSDNASFESLKRKVLDVLDDVSTLILELLKQSNFVYDIVFKVFVDHFQRSPIGRFKIIEFYFAQDELKETSLRLLYIVFVVLDQYDSAHSAFAQWPNHRITTVLVEITGRNFVAFLHRMRHFFVLFLKYFYLIKKINLVLNSKNLF